MEAHKQDTRNKIQLGGLIIKANLGEEDTAVILGILVAAADVMAGPEGKAARQRFRHIGNHVFLEGHKRAERTAPDEDSTA